MAGSTPDVGGNASQYNAIADRMDKSALDSALFQEKIADTANKLAIAQRSSSQLVAK